MRKATFKAGTARETAESDTGFSANGESSYTRRVAHPDGVRFKSWKRHRDPHRHPSKDNFATSRVQEAEIGQLQRKMVNERNLERRAKLAKQIEIKIKFVAKLKEQEANVTTIPGADEFEPWDKV